MKNVDISRLSFEPRKNFCRVVIQQGRVPLDADFNEQTAINLRCMRLMMLDLVGPGAGPEADCGFDVLVKSDGVPDERAPADKPHLDKLLEECGPGDFVIARGRYYVDGILCENHESFPYSKQAGVDWQTEGIEDIGRYLVYLDVFEREVSALDDESIREVALGGADTAARTAVAWRVRHVGLDSGEAVNDTWDNMKPLWDKWIGTWQPRQRGILKARAHEPDTREDSEGVVAPVRYRGPENQLYRVEIHEGGKHAGTHRPTFKFSRDNGVVAFRITDASDDGRSITLADWGRDDTLMLRVGDWVELLGEREVRGNLPGALLRVETVHPEMLQATLTGDSPGYRPVLARRWDQKAGEQKRGGLDLVKGAAAIHEDQWQTLEDGVEIMFQHSGAQVYRPGDYWLIPARVATADVLWPRHGGEAAALPPLGVEHHYAPLAIIDVADETTVVVPLTRKFAFRGSENFDRDVLTRG